MLSAPPYLGLLEKGLIQRQYESRHPQIFILGLPRSGTTLVYQYIVHRLRVAYITNRAGHYYASPCLITYLQRGKLNEYYSDFQSQYGKVQGDLAPREAGSFWGRFFGFEEYVGFQDMSSEDIQILRNTIACIQSAFGGQPFVNKNVKHMLRIDALSGVFPDAYFLVVERSLPQVALSVLRGRYENMSDVTQWWSVKPPNYAVLKDLPVAEQVAHQLASLQAKMDADFFEIPRERVIRLQYEEFCRDPEGVLLQLNKIWERVEFRNSPVESFAPSDKSPRNDEEMQLIELVKQYDITR